MFSFLNDAAAEDDPFFGPHMRHMRQMNNMMSSMMADPFGMFGGGGGALLGMGNMLGAPRHGSSLMPFMPHMNINRLLSGDMENNLMPGSSYSSSTVVMSSGPHGRPQVISSTSSTKVGPNGIKETRKTLEDSRTGTKKMAVGHHIGERAHVIEREQNVISGDQEETQEFINLDEEEVEDFDREFQEKAGGYVPAGRARIAGGSSHTQLALPAPPVPYVAPLPSVAGPTRPSRVRPSARQPIRHVSSTLASPPHHSRSSASVRELYSGSQPHRHRARHQRHQHAAAPRRSPDH